MEKTQLIHNTFGGGVVSPKLYGRTDLARYHNGCRQLKNFIVYPQGGIVRRPGTFYVNEVKTSAKATRLIPFVASSETAYVLEFGEGYIRFYTSSARVAVSGVVAYNGATAYTVGDLCSSGGVNYYCIAAVTGTTPPNTTYWYPLTGTIYEIPTPYTDTDLAGLQVVQSVDVLYICHASYAPRCLNHYARTDWTLTAFDYKNGPFLDENEIDAGTTDEDVAIAVSAIAKGATAVTITVTKAGVAFALFEGTANDVGRLVRIRHELNWGCIKITAAVSTSSATGTITDAFLYTTPSKHWRLGAWSPGMGWPQCVTFHQQRLWFARTTDRAQTVWGSVTGDFNNFDPNIETAGANYIANGEFDNGDTNWAGTTGWTFLTGTAKHGSGTTKLYQLANTVDGHNYRLSYTITNCTTGTVTASLAGTPTVTGTARSADGKYQEYFNSGNPGGSALQLGFTPTTGFDGEIDDVVLEDTQDIVMTGDDSGISLTISSDTLDAITWLMSQGSALLAGTIGGVYSILAGSGAAITPTNFNIKRENSYPCKTIKPLSFGNSGIFVQKGGLVVRDINYSFQSDAFGALDLTVFSDNITDSGLVEIARQVTPFSILWGVRDDGKLVGLTYEKDQQVVAWHLHETEGTYESIAVIPGALEDQAWFIVKRAINGSDVRYVEYADKINFDSLYSYHGVDSGVYTTGTGIVSMSLAHLEAEVVQVCGDGIEQTDKTVASGAIVVTSCDYCHAGLEYDAILETMDIDPGGGPQSILTKQKRIVESMFIFYRSSSPSHGAAGTSNRTGIQAGYITGTASDWGTGYNLNVILEEDESIIVLEGAEAGAWTGGDLYAIVEHINSFDFTSGYIYTGKKVLPFNKGWSDTATVYAVQTSPLPLGINAIVTTLLVSDR